MFSLGKFIDFLKENKIEGASQSSIGEVIGVPQAYVSLIIQEKRPFREEYLESIKTAYGNDIVDIFISSQKISTYDSGNEEPYFESTAGIKYYQRHGGKFIMRVPMVPIYAYAKYIDEMIDASVWDGDGFFDFPADQIYHGSYQAFEIKGDSMDDDSKRSLAHGDIVNARELSRDKWTSKLHTNKYPNWIIVLDDTILCKQITDHNLKNGDIVCHSLNPSPEYSDFTINLNKVRKLFNIVQKVSSSF